MKYGITDQLDPQTKDAANRFSVALQRLVFEWQATYGPAADASQWQQMEPEQLRSRLQLQVQLGDPLHVAAFAMFLWARGEPASRPAGDTNPVPADGWTCFHCGEHFPPTYAGQRAAEKHFSQVPTLPPECIDAMSPARELARRARRSEAFAGDMMKQRDQAEERLEVAESTLASIKHLWPGCTTLNDVRNEFDFLKGRAIAAEAQLKRVRELAPEAWRQAWDEIVGGEPA